MFIIRKNERTLNKIRNFKLIEKSNEREKRFFLKITIQAERIHLT